MQWQGGSGEGFEFGAEGGRAFGGAEGGVGFGEGDFGGWHGGMAGLQWWLVKGVYIGFKIQRKDAKAQRVQGFLGWGLCVREVFDLMLGAGVVVR